VEAARAGKSAQSVSVPVLAAFLAGPDAAFITGADVLIDGGTSA
jgi:hypothetical protein